LERNRISKGATTDNPVLVESFDQSSFLKGTIRQSLARLQSNLSIAQSEI
jgi:hypothetical protein